MSLTIGSTQSGNTQSGIQNQSTTLTYSVTVDSTPNNVLVVMVSTSYGRLINSVTFNGATMTEAIYIDYNAGARSITAGTYYLIGADAVTGNVVVTLPSPATIISHAVPFYGASGIGATASQYSVVYTPSVYTDSITTTQANSIIVGNVAAKGSVSYAISPDGSQTSWGFFNLNGDPNNVQGQAAYKTAATVGTYSIGWSNTNTTEFTGTVVEVQELVVSASPSLSPSVSPSFSPSASPSLSPSKSPSVSPSPSLSPSISPSLSFSPSVSPSVSPSLSQSPSFSPSVSPSLSISPSMSPSKSPSLSPSVSPSPAVPSNDIMHTTTWSEDAKH